MILDANGQPQLYQKHKTASPALKRLQNLRKRKRGTYWLEESASFTNWKRIDDKDELPENVNYDVRVAYCNSEPQYANYVSYLDYYTDINTALRATIDNMRYNDHYNYWVEVRLVGLWHRREPTPEPL